jgi:HK97 family phage portal protein
MAVVQSAGQITAVHQPWAPAGTLGGSVSLYEGVFADYGAIWRTQPNVRTVVSFLARNAAQLGLHIFDRTGDSDRRRITDGRAGRWLRRPTPYDKVSLYDLINWFVHDLCVYDNAYWAKIAVDTALATVPLMPQHTQPVGGSWFHPDAYRLHGGRGHRDLDPSQVVHVHGYNPDDRRHGVSPMETLRRIIAEDVASGRYREKFWLNGARHEGVIERPRDAPKWSDTARERFKTDWQARYAGGPDSGSAPILEEGMQFKEASFSAKDAEYIAARKLTREEVAAAFHVHPAMVGIMEHANFANMREQHRSTYQDTLGPLLSQLEAAFSLQLADDLDLPETAYFEFNIKEKMRGSFEEEAQSLQTAVGAPHMTRNEARARANLPRIDGGDELVTPLNVMIGGQASPTDAGAQNLSARLADGIAGLIGEKSALPAGRKDLDEDAQAEVDRHRQLLERYFGRQQAAVLARAGALDDPTVADVLDRDRWDDELTADLFGAALATARRSGQSVAQVLDADDDVDITEADDITEALEESSRGMAVEINDYTAGQLGDALDGDEPLDGAREVFATMAGVRAAIYAASRANTVWNFARGVASRALGADTKTWRVTSSNPRPEHAALDGETVPVGEPFSNGAMWPGDPVLPAEERANCQCTFDVSAGAA